jgi:hypothetical protein
MNILFSRLNCLHNTFYFLKRHFAVIISLGLIAASGRVIQLGGFGRISFTMNFILEILVETARIVLFLFVLGLANVRNGLLRIKHFFIHKEKRKIQLAVAIQNLKHHWVSISLNILGFLLIAWLLNYLIDLLAYQTCLYLTLKQDGILAGSSSEWTILLFFKNLSVIPFTLVFETLFFLWITNKMKNYKQNTAISE